MTVKRFILITSCLTLILGCSIILTGRYGKITPSSEARKLFEQYQINSELNYYISGDENFPRALMGLNKKYILASRLWRKIEMSPLRFRKVITDMQEKASQLNQRQYGFSITDDKGDTIGIWYSMLAARTSLEFINDYEVIVFPPDQDTYERYEERSVWP